MMGSIHDYHDDPHDNGENNDNIRYWVKRG